MSKEFPMRLLISSSRVIQRILGLMVESPRLIMSRNSELIMASNSDSTILVKPPSGRP